MIVTVKYGIEPIYEKNDKEQVKLLYGYIVSKCYKFEGLTGNIVLFPYVLNKNTYLLNRRRIPENASIGFNTIEIDQVFDDYIEAKTVCNTKNRKVAPYKSKNWYDSLQEFENLVSAYTSDMKINGKTSIKIKKPIR